MKALARTWKRLPGTARAGVIMLVIFLLIAIIGPQVTPYEPAALSTLKSQPPSGAHWFGTTVLGQDVFSQFLLGIRLTLELAFWVGVIATALSVIVGVAAAYLGGLWDDVLSLASNIFLVIPALPLLIVVLGYLEGTGDARGQLPVILVLAALGWPWGARVVRAQSLSIRGRDFIAAARETGERTWRIIFVEIMPNLISLIAASFVNTVLYAVGASVALAFIGLTDTSLYSLGTTLFWAEQGSAVQQGLWWWYVPAGLAVALLGTALVLLNTGIDELSNPRLRDARSTTKLSGRRVWPTDPTPVLGAGAGRRGLGLGRSPARQTLVDEAALAVAPAGGADNAGDLS